jgi:hypothetical protein
VRRGAPTIQLRGGADIDSNLPRFFLSLAFQILRIVGKDHLLSLALSIYFCASFQQSNIIRFFSSGLSILGASYIIFAYVAFPEIRSPNRKLLFILSVLDLFMAVAYIIPVTVPDSSLCRFQAVSIALFASASIAWSVRPLFFFACILETNVQIFHANRMKSIPLYLYDSIIFD